MRVVNVFKAIFWAPFDFVEGFKTRRFYDKNGVKLPTRPSFMFDDIPVYIHNHYTTLISGVSSRIPMASATYVENTDRMIIFANRALMDESTKFRFAALGHEYAHCIIHADQIKKVAESNKNKIVLIIDDEMEEAADEFAYRKGFNVIEMLQRLKHYGFNVDGRIKKIQSLMKI